MGQPQEYLHKCSDLLLAWQNFQHCIKKLIAVCKHSRDQLLPAHSNLNSRFILIVP